MYLFFEQDSKLFKVECDPEKDELLLDTTYKIYRHKGKEGFYFYKVSYRGNIELLLSEQEALNHICSSMNWDANKVKEIGMKLVLKLPEG